MSSLLRSSRAARDIIRAKRFIGEIFVKYPTSRSKTTVTDYDIEDKLLSAENRQRCMKKMSRYPQLGITLRDVTNEVKLSAILIALCTEENMQNISLLYTTRSHLLSRHMRQISFPGGMKEDDEDFVQCALRETEEEIGLHPSRVEIWGSGILLKPPRTVAIMPVVGVVKNFKESELKLNTSEVEEAFLIPIKRLASPQSLYFTQFRSGYSSPVFVIDNKRIWGITGLITNFFLNCFLPTELNNIQNRIKFIRQFKSKPSS